VVSVGKELLRDYINATVGFPKLAAHTKIHVKTLHQMFGPNGNPTARKLFEIVAYLQNAEVVRFEVRSTRTARQNALLAEPLLTKFSPHFWSNWGPKLGLFALVSGVSLK
jgi:hypothetical protein